MNNLETHTFIDASTFEPLNRDTLWTLETYAKRRPAFREQVLAHKKLRSVALGNHVTLLFEDHITMRYQVQEMLRIEKIFEEDGIAHELEAFLPLVPTGTNLKATMMIEYSDVTERKAALVRLKDVEHKVWLQVEGEARVYALADEDLPRSNAEKTSAVHFLRFELTPAMCAALKYGVTLSMGIDHPMYAQNLDPISQKTRDALALDIL